MALDKKRNKKPKESHQLKINAEKHTKKQFGTKYQEIGRKYQNLRLIWYKNRTKILIIKGVV